MTPDATPRPPEPPTDGRPSLWDRLLAYYTEDDARLWLSLPHQLLEHAIPAELLARGEGDRLHQVLDTLDGGTYL